ncbi:ATP-binding protein [Mycolicibacterium bacteremicum]|uniref:histidine kinase n=1 Tax=Mycolicibacterium bacteremicum TaxID=564198 RepID=A0A1W9YWD3_MYCBA|nr:ATP-binding protein [Mycolicibacterium bacteremicum]MCV7431548.1 HAMP domain-containing protein [Mycolicibacterium bacteremicum]ORA04378.1 ATP-binding protein [Mycolicibacterium bacteremicum]
MTSFAAPRADDETHGAPAQPVKRPARWSLSNWPVGAKVLAIALVPLVLAATFGGLRIYSGFTEASDLRRAADRAELVPAIENYMAALEAALLAQDPQQALGDFDTGRQELQTRLDDTDVVPDVDAGVTALLQDGQDLVNRVASNSISLRDRVTTYAPILLTAEDAVNGSVRVDDAAIRAETLGLSRAIGARGQMTMQQLLVDRGAEVPETELRTSMSTVAGTEPSTLSGMSQILGVGSAEAQELQSQFVGRMAIMADPAAVLVNNPQLRESIAATGEIAGRVIEQTTASVTGAVDEQAAAARSAAVRDAVVVIAAMLLALLIVALVARSLVRPLRRLRDSALKVAHTDLARELDQVRAGGDPGPVTPIPVHTTEEVGQVAHAVDELHEQAVLLAGEQARLQVQVSDMFETLSRRSRSLVDQQLTLIDQLERDEQDPQRLDSLFRLDHLAARMRRNGANLLVLAGTNTTREHAEPVPVAAVVNAAASEVEDYTRIVTASLPDCEIVGATAADLVHVLAELMDNALRYSPPATAVRVSGVRTEDGALVLEVGDEGLGMAEPDLRVANTRLQSGGEVNPYTARHMGLFVVGRLADRHGLVVRLRATVPGEPSSGTTAGVYLPAELVAGAPVGPRFAEIVPAPAADPFVAPVPQESAAPLDHPAGSALPQRTPGSSGFEAAPRTEPLPTAAPAEATAFFTPRPQAPAEPVDSDDAIYQKMLSEWLVDPTDLGTSTDLDWKSVWDNGWSAAESAEATPVDEHTPEGLPVRRPGARLVPGAGDTPGRHASVASDSADPPTGPLPDPAAIRASLSSHFGGVHAGRSHARDTEGEQ